MAARRRRTVVQRGCITVYAFLYGFFLQPPFRTIWSDASDDEMESYGLESGAWWRMDVDERLRRRLRQHACGRNDLSINALELIGMVVTV